MPVYNIILGEVTLVDDTISQLMGWDSALQQTVGYATGALGVSYFANDAGYITSTALAPYVLKAGDTITGPMVRTITTLTDAATIAISLNDNNYYRVVLGGNRTLGAATNLPASGDRKYFILEVVQDTTGGRTLDLSNYNTGGVDTDINYGANEVTFLSFIADDTTVYLVGNRS